MRDGHYACATLFRGGRLLLGKRSARRGTYPHAWDVIGGRVEAGETIEQALVREMREEIGLTPISFAMLSAIREPNPDVNGRATYHLFVVDDWRGDEPAVLGNEHTELRWFTVEEACALPDLALDEYCGAFRSIRQDQPASA